MGKITKTAGERRDVAMGVDEGGGELQSILKCKKYSCHG